MHTYTQGYCVYMFTDKSITTCRPASVLILIYDEPKLLLLTGHAIFVMGQGPLKIKEEYIRYECIFPNVVIHSINKYAEPR